MKQVRSFEANLLRLLQGFLHHVPLEQLLPLLNKAEKEPTQLTPAALALVQDTLAKGCVLWLTRAGAWRQETFLRQGKAIVGSLWERTEPTKLGLTFSAQSLHFLLWITSNRLSSADHHDWFVSGLPLTVGDQLLLYLAYEALRTVNQHGPIQSQRGFRHNVLCRLFYPEEVGLAASVPLDFSPWLVEPGSALLEVLQPKLAERWHALEQQKQQGLSFSQLAQWGAAQERVLLPWLQACEKADRPDLARFVLVAAQRVLQPECTLDTWFGSSVPEPGMKIAERLQVYRQALVLVQAMHILGRWQNEARSVGYFDEAYGKSQLWKTLWEQHSGETTLTRAQELSRLLEMPR